MQNPETGHMEPIHPETARLLEEVGRCVFYLGEEIRLKNGLFRVAAMGKKFIRLEGLPGTHCDETYPKKLVIPVASAKPGEKENDND